MAKVKLLRNDVASKIAAGEVVERPSSVVKELMENSIDAGGDRITVDILSAGKKLIRVTDNGEGMSREDCLLALERYATSKVEEAQDLQQITTLGFRGEALPSIASVSRMVISTRDADSAAGIEVAVNGGATESVKEIGIAGGTTVEVRDLFYNVPARRKFLKTDSTEYKHILEVFCDLALVHPDSTFVLTTDEKIALELPSVSDWNERAFEVIGSEFEKNSLVISNDLSPINVGGLVGSPDLHRPTSAGLMFFVNKRRVKSPTLFAAVRDGYAHLIPAGRYPVAVINIEMDPALVDVNVHPAKTEIRFSRGGDVRSAVVAAIRSALTPKGTSGGATPIEQLGEGTYSQLTFESGSDAVKEVTTAEYGDSTAEFWQLHNAYIVAPIKGGVVFVDQHAAHERILYEKAMEALSATEGHAQQLLFPVTIDLGPVEFEEFQKCGPQLKKLGFSLTPLSGRTVTVEAIPVSVIRWMGAEILPGMLLELSKLSRGAGPIEAVARAYACSGAIKRGRKLSHTEMGSLFDELFATMDPYSCPHGRPTLIRIPLAELDRRFKRI